MKSTNANWSVAQAKQRLSELVRAAAEGPQVILNRDHPVAVVVDVASYAEYLAWRQSRITPTLEQAFAELRTICVEEEYVLDPGPRDDRVNPFAEALGDTR